MTTSMKFIQGRVEIPTEGAGELLEAVKSNRELLTKAVDIFLKSKGYSHSRIIHDANGKIFADVTGEGPVPDFKPLRHSNGKNMSKGWNRTFMGFTSELRTIIATWRKKGRKEIAFDALYDQVMEVFKDRQGSKFKPMERAKFGQYLHDKRLFPNIKYNAVKRLVTFH